MIHADLRLLGARQDDIVGTWQLAERGWTPSAVKHRTAGLRRLHDGVFILGQAPPTERQRRRAAGLTAPDTTLSHLSAGASQRINPWFGTYETVTRPGNGGPRRYGDLLLRRSLIVMAHVTLVDGLRVTCTELTLADLAPALTDRELRKAFREGIRLRRTTARKVHRLTQKYPNRHGSTRLGRLAEIYVRLPIQRCRSDAEAVALELLDRAKIVMPEVNRRFAGEEADLCWPSLRLIIEIDGPQWHLFKDEDARKTAIWRAAGFTVLRISSDAVFDHPARFLALCPRPA